MNSDTPGDAAGRFAYRKFWTGVGRQFPDLGAAGSTEQYRQSEQRLFRDYLPNLEGLKVFKTDLWDEAKNTRILHWASQKGAATFGADLSFPIAQQALNNFGNDSLQAVVADVRWLPFREASFDAIYSMGTVEHFDETQEALGEIYRVLSHGGRAIIGVPNRWDPFLRPFMVTLLYRVGLYGYGFEKSYSRRTFRRMLELAKFSVVTETGLLFIPGWLRMLDLACHSWMPLLGNVTRLAVKPFANLERRFPRLRRHGYLLATVVDKPPE